MRTKVISKTGLMLFCCVAAPAIGVARTPSETTQTLATTLSATETQYLRAIDSRAKLEPREFSKTGSDTWESEWKRAEFPFDEMIYYWNAPLERGEGFRLYLQVRFKEGDESPWLYAGYWGRVKPSGPREKPKFDRGVLDLDQLLLKEKATAWRFRVVSEGNRVLSKPPFLGVITTDNHPTEQAIATWRKRLNHVPSARILDVPLRKQQDIDENPLPDRCQSAALASAMQYFGTTVPLEQIIAHTTDPEYKYFGIWPRTLGAAHEFGFEAYLERFRDWESVKKALAENKVILCSQTMPRRDTYIAPPYPSMGGHIVALCGVTDDGRVVVTDSALAAGGGPLLQWVKEDYEKIWMRNKGGVAMVICPPEGAPVKLVDNLPPFPDRNTTGTAKADRPTSPSASAH